jgi:mannitol 2-dehydrogenase
MGQERLSTANLGRLPSAVAIPHYDRDRVGQAIVHLSLGGFHRAHQALYLEELLERDGPSEWGVCGVGLLPSDGAMAAALRPQELLYTLVERDEGVEDARVIGALRGYLHAPAEPETVLARLADPATRLVTLTVTEGGYYRDEGTGELQAGHPSLRHDLEHRGEPPASIYGYLAEALDRRRRAGTAPFTVLSCDNLQGNGEVARRMLVAFASLRDAELGRWIAANVAFPCCMVDRITPTTTDEHRALVRGVLAGIEDAWPVVAEPFRQWVVEDRFCNGRPALESVGVQMTGDVHPYELMKIRLLNAGHQAMCHLGLVLGYRTADAAMRDPRLHAIVSRYMDTARPLIVEPPGMSLVDYQRTLLHRFANPAVKDQLARIAYDAASRIPKFVLASAREQLARSGDVRMFALVVAAWIRVLDGTDETGAPIDVADPMIDALRAAVCPGDTDPARFLALREVFGDDLGANPTFAAAVRAALESLYRKGCSATLSAYLAP